MPSVDSKIFNDKYLLNLNIAHANDIITIVDTEIGSFALMPVPSDQSFLDSINMRVPKTMWRWNRVSAGNMVMEIHISFLKDIVKILQDGGYGIKYISWKDV